MDDKYKRSIKLKIPFDWNFEPRLYGDKMHKNVYPFRKTEDNENVIKLVCKAVWFYSHHDEDAFFEWIKKIPSIKKFEGIRDELYLYMESSIILDDDLRELVALFYRYKVDMKQLAVFLNDNNSEWFYGKTKGCWRKKIFGAKKAA